MAIAQYIVIRKDLLTVLNWPLGAVIAQGCHASTAALVRHYDHEDTKRYVEHVNNMRKIVLGVENLEQLQKLALKLNVANLDHFLWVEQPENMLTALATRPYEKSQIQSLFKGLELFQL